MGDCCDAAMVEGTLEMEERGTDEAIGGAAEEERAEDEERMAAMREEKGYNSAEAGTTVEPKCEDDDTEDDDEDDDITDEKVEDAAEDDVDCARSVERKDSVHACERGKARLPTGATSSDRGETHEIDIVRFAHNSPPFSSGASAGAGSSISVAAAASVKGPPCPCNITLAGRHPFRTSSIASSSPSPTAS